METEGGSRSYALFKTKIDSALTTPLPEPIDINHDSLIPDKTNKFLQMLTSALRTRKLLVHLQTRPFSLQDVLDANPSWSTQEATQFYDDTTALVTEQLATAASIMAPLVKGLTIIQQGDMSRWKCILKMTEAEHAAFKNRFGSPMGGQYAVLARAHAAAHPTDQMRWWTCKKPAGRGAANGGGRGKGGGRGGGKGGGRAGGGGTRSMVAVNG